MCLLDYLINSDLSIYHIFDVTEQTKKHPCPLVAFGIGLLDSDVLRRHIEKKISGDEKVEEDHAAAEEEGAFLSRGDPSRLFHFREAFADEENDPENAACHRRQQDGGAEHACRH